MKRLILLGALVTLLLIPAAHAGRNMAGAALSVAPAQPVVGDSVVFSGCGFQPNWSFIIEASDPAGNKFVYVDSVISDASGCLTTADAPFVVYSSGTWSVAAYYGNGHKVAPLVFTVASP